MIHGIQKYKCCLGLTIKECANIPSRHCTGLAPDHGTHGPQWVSDEIRKAEKMTDKIDTSSEAVRLHSPYHDGSMVLDNDGGWVSIDDYRALSARVAELEAGLTATIKRENDANARAMKHLRRAEKLEICSKNYAEFSHEWRARAEAAEQRAETFKERYLAVVGDKINLRGEVATLEAKLAKAMDIYAEAMSAEYGFGDDLTHYRDQILAEIQTEAKENDT